MKQGQISTCNRGKWLSHLQLEPKEGGMPMNKKMYVDVAEVCKDWGVSRAQGYKIIKQLNERMIAINPNLIVLTGKANRKFYEENCYGMGKEA